jgi:hypothetical protein
MGTWYMALVRLVVGMAVFAVLVVIAAEIFGRRED